MTPNTRAAAALLPCPAGHIALLHKVKRDDDLYPRGWYYVDCIIKNCGWHDGGWPTAKEAHDHWNDRDRTTPAQENGSASEGTAAFDYIGWPARKEASDDYLRGQIERLSVAILQWTDCPRDNMRPYGDQLANIATLVMNELASPPHPSATNNVSHPAVREVTIEPRDE